MTYTEGTENVFSEILTKNFQNLWLSKYRKHLELQTEISRKEPLHSQNGKDTEERKY
jgi:hypothetical protein